MSGTLAINLGKHIFCNHISGKLYLVPIWVFYLINVYVQDGIFNSLYNWNTILVPKKSYHLRKLRSISISWYYKFDVQVCFIIHIWFEVIVVLWPI